MGRRDDLAAASEHLVAADPAFAGIVAEAGPAVLPRARPRRGHFAELTRAIVFQQLHGKAAETIHGRFVALFDGPPTPEGVLELPVEDVRGAGLSGNKAASIRDLSEKVIAGTVELDRMGRLSDDRIVAELVTVRGIGRWTAEMFLMFELGRLDVWPVDDFGVRKGYAALHGMTEHPTAKALLPLGDRYRPHRSVAAWYCWRAVDTFIPE